MENKDILNDGQNTVSEEHIMPLYEAPKLPLTALEFEIAEESPSIPEHLLLKLAK